MCNFFKLFISKEGERKRERVCDFVPIGSVLSDHNPWGWARVKPEIKNSIQVCLVASRCPSTWCISRNIGGKWNSQDSSQHSYLGYQHHKWWFNTLSPSKDPGLQPSFVYICWFIFLPLGNPTLSWCQTLWMCCWIWFISVEYFCIYLYISQGY